jgi:hypothetical protein
MTNWLTDRARIKRFLFWAWLFYGLGAMVLAFFHINGPIFFLAGVGWAYSLFSALRA